MVTSNKFHNNNRLNTEINHRSNTGENGLLEEILPMYTVLFFRKKCEQDHKKGMT